MPSIKIQFRNETKTISVKQGMLTMFVSDRDGNAVLYAGTTDAVTKVRNIGYKYVGLAEGDEICVEVVETDNPVPDKLKQFRLLEAALKKEGII